MKILKTTDLVGLRCGPRGMQVIPESDVYRLIMRSDLPETERVQDWVCEEVLPTIRKTGGTYQTDHALAMSLSDPDYVIGVLTKMKELKAATAMDIFSVLSVG